MIYVAHRGNIFGPDPRENDPLYLKDVMGLGFYVEVDIWVIYGDKWYTGHDKPMYMIDRAFCVDNKVICHAKNKEALVALRELNLSFLDLNYFWHQDDNYAMTSTGIIISHPKSEFLPGSIAMLPERAHFGDLSKAYGICSDYIASYNRK